MSHTCLASQSGRGEGVEAVAKLQLQLEVSVLHCTVEVGAKGRKFCTVGTVLFGGLFQFSSAPLLSVNQLKREGGRVGVGSGQHPRRKSILPFSVTECDENLKRGDAGEEEEEKRALPLKKFFKSRAKLCRVKKKIFFRKKR